MDITDRGASRRQLAMYAAGCLAFSLGVKQLVDAGLGVDPLHAMAIGLVQRLDLPYVQLGAVVSAATLLALAVWSAWTRRLPPLSVFVTMATVAFLVDGWKLLSPPGPPDGLLPPLALRVLGLLIYAYGSALIIMSGVGVRVMDLLALTMMRRWGWRFFSAKMLIEALFVAVALLAGGPIGLATLAFLGLVGPLVEPMVWVNRRLLKLPMHSYWHGLTRIYVVRGEARPIASAKPTAGGKLVGSGG